MHSSEKKISADRHTVNRYLYRTPFMEELCYRDENYQWHSFVRQGRPHTGLGDFCAYYSTVGEFLELDEADWFEQRAMPSHSNLK